MADENNKVTEEIEEGKKKSSSILKMGFIWTIIFVVQMVVLYFLVSKFFAPKYLPAIETGTQQVSEVKNTSDIGDIYLLEDIIVNPKDTEGRRIVNVTVGFEYANKSVLEELEKRDIQLRDYLISFFGDRKISQIDDVADKDSLRTTINLDVNNMLPYAGISAVYFSNFIIHNSNFCWSTCGNFITQPKIEQQIQDNPIIIFTHFWRDNIRRCS